jgi:hypothetical protein
MIEHVIPTRYEKEVMLLKYELYVDDNYYYMDDDERYKAGEFDTIDEAVAAAKKIVDDFLLSIYKKRPDITAKELYDKYKKSGEDPWIHPNYTNYNSWDYAEARCIEICQTPTPAHIATTHLNNNGVITSSV